MSPKLRNILIVSGVLAGAYSAYLLYRYYGKGKSADVDSAESSVDESRVTADAKSNPLRIYR